MGDGGHQECSFGIFFRAHIQPNGPLMDLKHSCDVFSSFPPQFPFREGPELWNVICIPVNVLSPKVQDHLHFPGTCLRWLLLLREAVEAQVSVLTTETGSEVGGGKTARVSPQLDCSGRRVLGKAEQMGIVSGLSVSVSGRVTLARLANSTGDSFTDNLIWYAVKNGSGSDARWMFLLWLGR